MGSLHLSLVLASTVLTLGDVLQRAQEHAPAVADARAVVGEAAARGSGASPFLAANPEVELSAGNRSGAHERDLEVSLSQSVEIAGQRGSRRAAARFAIAGAEAGLEVALRRAVEEAGAGFYRVLHGRERVALAEAAEQVASQLLEAAQKRYAAGDIAALELNLARIAWGRAQAERAAAHAEVVAREAELRSLLGMRFEEPLALSGDLRERAMVDPAAATRDADTRPEMRRALAGRQQAEAELSLGRRGVWPDLGLSARYEREEGTPIWWGGVTVSLPLFKRGQEEEATARARLDRAVAAEAAVRRSIDNDTHAALASYEERRAALRRLEELVLPSVDDNDGLALRSFEVGEIRLGDLLLARREGLEARVVYLDALLSVALNEIEILARTGGLQ